MELNDLKIRQLIRDMREQRADGFSAVLEELKKETGMYIYRYPAMAYRKDRDTCSEFYLFVLERMDKVMASFPDGAEVRFKTWFNYVLRNQYHNFSFYQQRRKVPCVSLDGREDEFPVELFEEEDAGFEDLVKCLEGIGEWDRILIKFHYLPGSLEASELRRTVLVTGLPIGEVLDIRKELILAQREEVGRKREIAAKIGFLNRRLSEWKYRLTSLAEKNRMEPGGMNRLLASVARAETARSRMIRELRSPDRKSFKQFSRLFTDGTAAGRRLELARKKLRFEVLSLAKKKDGVA